MIYLAIVVTLIRSITATTPTPYYTGNPQIKFQNFKTTGYGEFQIDEMFSSFMMRLEYDLPSSKTFNTRCAGALVAERFVLTSGTCGAQRTFSSEDLMAFSMTPLWNSFKTNVVRAFFYKEFWKSRYPDLALVELEDEVPLKENITTLIDFPKPLAQEIKVYHQVCVIYGFDGTFDSYIREQVIGFEGYVISNRKCRKYYAAYGDTTSKKQSFDEIFCMAVSYNQSYYPLYYSKGGPVVCDGKLIGVLTYFDMFKRPAFRLFVATRVDRFYSSIYMAVGKPRTTTEDISTLEFADSTDDLGQPLEDVDSEKLKKTIMLVFILLAIAAAVLCGCYSCFWLFKCRPRSLGVKVKDDRSVTTLEMVKIEEREEFGVVKNRDDRWFHPEKILTEIVMPFFVVLIAMILNKRISKNFCPGYRRPQGVSHSFAFPEPGDSEEERHNY